VVPLLLQAIFESTVLAGPWKGLIRNGLTSVFPS
jgi:hypothetical protein